MASKFAKKHKGYQGVCLIDTDEKREKALKLFPVEDVWGIGYRHSKKMEYYGINGVFIRIFLTATLFKKRDRQYISNLIYVL